MEEERGRKEGSPFQCQGRSQRRNRKNLTPPSQQETASKEPIGGKDAITLLKGEERDRKIRQKVVSLDSSSRGAQKKVWDGGPPSSQMQSKIAGGGYWGRPTKGAKQIVRGKSFSGTKRVAFSKRLEGGSQEKGSVKKKRLDYDHPRAEEGRGGPSGK